MVLRSTAWVAELLGVPAGTVRSMISRRQLPTVRIGPRIVRFDENEIMRWLDARRVAVQPHEELARRAAARRASR
jgi:excisionase family DNA binding protein